MVYDNIIHVNNLIYLLYLFFYYYNHREIHLIVNIMDYSNTTTYKTLINRNSHPEKGVSATVSLWRNTAAITTVYLANGSGGNFASGSTFKLYGIEAAK